MFLRSKRRLLSFGMALWAFSGAAMSDELDALPYLSEDVCSALMGELTLADNGTDAQLNFVSNVCYTSRLLDFRDRAEGVTNSGDNGATRSLPRASEREVGEATALDRQIQAATQQSEDAWDDLAQGDPKAAYDLLRRLLGEEGSGS